MSVLTNTTPIALWQDIVRHAEDICSITLEDEIEAYLVSLLIRYTDKPEVAKQIFAKAFLEAQQYHGRQRNVLLQVVGDQCLIYAGLFPQVAAKKHVKISYFVNLGQTAYSAVSRANNDLYSSLAMQFVELMDVLQSVPHDRILLPIEAYEQWHDVKSRRALRILLEYTHKPL